jgi:hypothetical protein
MFTSNTLTWLKGLWHSFTNWMLEPISFPGMTYVPRFTRTRTGK